MTNPVPVPALTDFGDAVGPIMVKELRQGMRSRVFTGVFLFVQGLLLLFMMAGFSESSDGRATGASFWILLEIALLIVMPMRGLSALHAEIRHSTMELISLTRMSAWKITLGKWAALMSQSLLLAVAVMPYIVLRYFFGGMNVVAELVMLLVVIGLSGLLTALMVGLSVLPNFFLRGLFTLPVWVLVVRFMGESVYRVTRGDSIAPFGLGGMAWLAVVPAAVFLGYYLLDMAASRISPEAVNYVTRRRLIGLGAFGLTVALVHANGSGLHLVYPFSLFGLLAFDAFTEHPATVASVSAPFRKLPFGLLLERLFAPGWFSGIFYVLLLAGILAGAFRGFPDVWNASGIPLPEGAWIWILSSTASAMFPLGLTLLFWPRHAQPIIPYCVTAAAVAAVSTAMITLGVGGDQSLALMLGSPLPPVAAYLALSPSGGPSEVRYALSMMGAVIVGCIFIASRRHAVIQADIARSERADQTD